MTKDRQKKEPSEASSVLLKLIGALIAVVGAGVLAFGSVVNNASTALFGAVFSLAGVGVIIGKSPRHIL